MFISSLVLVLYRHQIAFPDVDLLSNLKKIFIKYMARRQYQSSLDQINSFREFLAYFWLYIRLHPTVDENVVLRQYHQIVIEAFCENLGAKLNDYCCIESFQSFMREVVSK